MWRRLQKLCGACDLDSASLGHILTRALRREDEDSLKSLLQGLCVAAEARSRGVDHLHAHFASAATRAALVAHQVGGPSFSFTAHAKDIYSLARDPDLLPQALDGCAFAVTVTEFNVAQLQRLNPANQHKICRIYNAVPLDEIIPTPCPDTTPPTVLAAILFTL